MNTVVLRKTKPLQDFFSVRKFASEHITSLSLFPSYEMHPVITIVYVKPVKNESFMTAIGCSMTPACFI